MPGQASTMLMTVVDANTVPQGELSYVLKTDASAGTSTDPFVVGVYYHHGSQPSNAQMLNDVAALLGVTSATNVTEETGKVTFTVMNGLAKSYYELTYANAVECWVGEVNGVTRFVDEGAAFTDLDGYAVTDKPLSAAPAGYALDNTGTETGITGTVDDDNAHYYPVASTITGDNFDIETGYVKVATAPTVNGTGASGFTLTSATLNNTTTTVAAKAMLKATDTIKFVLTAKAAIDGSAWTTTGMSVSGNDSTATVDYSGPAGDVATNTSGTLTLRPGKGVAKDATFTVVVPANGTPKVTVNEGTA